MRPVVAALLLSSLTAQVPRAETQAEEVDRLVRRLTDKSGHAEAQQALLRIGRPAVRGLLAVVVRNGRVPNTPQTRRALRTLGLLGPAVRPSFDQLVDAVAVCREDVYIDLLRAIADLVPYSPYQGDPRLVDRIVALNRDVYLRLSRGNDRQRFQYEYDRLLKRSLVDPKQGLRAMIEELQQNRTFRREVAAEVVGRMGAGALEAVPALAGALAKKAPVVGQVGGFRVPEYRDEFPRVGAEALLAIAPKDPRAAVAWGWRLENAARADDRLAAALELAGFGAASRGEVPRLIEALGDPDRRVRLEVITVLGMLGPAARDATERLRAIAGDAEGDKAGRARAAAALRSIEAAPQKR